MKRLMLASTLLLFAAGCSTAEEPTEDSQMESSSEMVQETTTDSSATEEDLESVPEEELNSDNVIAEQPEYPEWDLIQETIAVEELEGHLVTDNPGTRVIIFVEEGEQAYKSIFIKSENRLKLVDLRADELVLNEIMTD